MYIIESYNMANDLKKVRIIYNYPIFKYYKITNEKENIYLLLPEMPLHPYILNRYLPNEPLFLPPSPPCKYSNENELHSNENEIELQLIIKIPKDLDLPNLEKQKFIKNNIFTNVFKLQSPIYLKLPPGLKLIKNLEYPPGLFPPPGLTFASHNMKVNKSVKFSL